MLAPTCARANGTGCTCQLQVLLPASADDNYCLTKDSRDMAVLPSDLFASTLSGARRFATKAVDLPLSKAADAISAAGLAEWLTLLVAYRKVVVSEYLNGTPTPKRAVPSANNDRSRSAML